MKTLILVLTVSLLNFSVSSFADDPQQGGSQSGGQYSDGKGGGWDGDGASHDAEMQRGLIVKAVPLYSTPDKCRSNLLAKHIARVMATGNTAGSLSSYNNPKAPIDKDSLNESQRQCLKDAISILNSSLSGLSRSVGL